MKTNYWDPSLFLWFQIFSRPSVFSAFWPGFGTWKWSIDTFRWISYHLFEVCKRIARDKSDKHILLKPDLHIFAHISSREQSSKSVSAQPPQPRAGMLCLNPFRSLQFKRNHCKIISFCVFVCFYFFTSRLFSACHLPWARFWGRKLQISSSHRSCPPLAGRSPGNAMITSFLKEISN